MVPYVFANTYLGAIYVRQRVGSLQAMGTHSIGLSLVNYELGRTCLTTDFRVVTRVYTFTIAMCRSVAAKCFSIGDLTMPKLRCTIHRVVPM